MSGFVKPPYSQADWLRRKHGAFEIDGADLGFSSEGQSSRYETRSHLSHVRTLLNATQGIHIA